MCCVKTDSFVFLFLFVCSVARVSGGRVKASCYSSRCHAEGARDLPKKRVHSGKFTFASLAGKSPVCNLKRRSGI